MTESGLLFYRDHIVIPFCCGTGIRQLQWQAGPYVIFCCRLENRHETMTVMQMTIPLLKVFLLSVSSDLMDIAAECHSVSYHVFRINLRGIRT